MMVSMSTRWQDADVPRGATYDARWATLAASGASIHGEADLVDELLGRTGGGHVLDAGCGTGRVAIELARRGHSVVGVDADAGMLDAAIAKDTAVTWLLADLVDVGAHVEDHFDVVVLAGNVMIFLAPGTEGDVLARLADRLSPTGRLVAGFSIRPGRLPLATYDRLAAAAGLVLESRWATWGRDPYRGGEYAVTVHRRAAVAAAS